MERQSTGLLRGDAWWCPICGNCEWAETKDGKPKLSRKKPEPNVRQLSEEDLQCLFIQCCKRTGFIVLETSERRKKMECDKCGHVQFDPGGRGVDEGIADVLVSHRTWPRYVFGAFETKGPTTKVTPAQQLLADQGRNLIYRDLGTALNALQELHKRFSAENTFDVSGAALAALIDQVATDPRPFEPPARSGSGREQSTP